MSDIDVGLRHRALFSLLNRYPHISFRCGNYYCFHTNTISNTRITHPHNCTPLPSPELFITSLQVIEPESEHTPNIQQQIQQNLLPPGESIQQIFDEINKYFRVSQDHQEIIDSSNINLFPEQRFFRCCLCLEDCSHDKLFQGCIKRCWRDQFVSNSNENNNTNNNDVQNIDSKLVCKECMLAFIGNRVDSTPYSIPQFKCLNCNERIPTNYWMECLRYPEDINSNSGEQGDKKQVQHNENLKKTIKKCKF